MAWLTRARSSFEGVADEAVMDAVRRAGDGDALAELMRRWHAPLRDLCLRMTGRGHLGDELAQEAFVRVFLNRERFEPTRRFSTWIWRIALNLCHDTHRREIRRAEDPLPEPGEPGVHPASLETAPDLHLVDSERADQVRLALAALSDAHRTVLVLREYEGLKIREIAEVLAVPEGTVKSRLAEALTQLGARLRPTFHEPANP